MNPNTLVTEVESGNTATVEAEWMRLLEQGDGTPDRLSPYHVVLGALCATGRQSSAEELAWAAIEAVSGKWTAKETLAIAGPYLLAVGDCQELRSQVVAIYRRAYGDVEGFAGLLEEAGLEGGRPVRRAVRTLEVCLAVDEGDYLVGRNDFQPARIEKIDVAAWQFTITTCDGEDALGAVHLADRFYVADVDDFHVMRYFSRDRLLELLKKDAVSVLAAYCKGRDSGVDTDELESMLVPDLIAAADYKKWWTRTRTALRRSPHIEIEGRSPSVLKYVEAPALLVDGLLAKLEATKDPTARWGLIEAYRSECNLRGEKPSDEVLVRFREGFASLAERLSDASQAALSRALEVGVRRLLGDESVPEQAVAAFAAVQDIRPLLTLIQSDPVFDLVCTCLDKTDRPDWPNVLLEILAKQPHQICDRSATRLVRAGCEAESFEPIMKQILAAPVENVEALSWLWKGPSDEASLPMPSPVVVFSRILRVVAECRRSDKLERSAIKKIVTRIRSVLSARKYQRFEKCLDQLDPAMAAAWRTQLNQSDNLGRAVREDLTIRLTRKFPIAKSRPAQDPWIREDVIFVTSEGMSRRSKEIDHHLNVKIKENAKAIGDAAEHGDLSENSEYKFALEERDLLQARLAQMNSEMSMARVISPGDVATDHVGIGCRVRMQRVDDGEPYEMVILGPWEADPTKQIFNYRTPVAQTVLGKKRRDQVEFDFSSASGTYEVLSIENALAETGA